MNYDEMIAAGWTPADAANKVKHPEWDWHQCACSYVWFGPPQSPCAVCEEHQERQERLYVELDLDLP